MNVQLRERSKKLQRQFSRHLGSDEAEAALIDLAAGLQVGESATDAQIRILSLLPEFFDAIEESYRQNDEKVKLAIRNLQLSSDELGSANLHLEKLNLSVSTMLDSLAEGLLFFDHTGRCAPSFSKACLTLLETDPADKHFSEVLQLPELERLRVEEWIEMLFNDTLALDFDELVAIGPSTFHHSRGLKVELTYRPMRRRNKLVGVLVVATDKTSEEAANRLALEKQAEASRTLTIARNRNGFIRFLADAEDMLGLAHQSVRMQRLSDGLAEDVHTIKGLAATFSLMSLTETLHELENVMSDTPVNFAAFASQLESVESALRDQKQFSSHVLGSDFERRGATRVLDVERLRDFAGLLRTQLPETNESHAILQRFMDGIACTPVHEWVAGLEIQLAQLADRFGKQVRTVVEGENFALLTEAYEALYSSFVHLTRNIVDHGIEDPRLREFAGKDPVGTVRIHTKRSDDKPGWFTLSIEDDGTGIDPEAVRARARQAQMEVDGLSDSALFDQLFDSGFSTRESASHTSGRGVGLSAVRRAARELGGDVAIMSVLGEGTRFTFTLPFLWNYA